MCVRTLKCAGIHVPACVCDDVGAELVAPCQPSLHAPAPSQPQPSCLDMRGQAAATCMAMAIGPSCPAMHGEPITHSRLCGTLCWVYYDGTCGVCVLGHDADTLDQHDMMRRCWIWDPRRMCQSPTMLCEYMRVGACGGDVFTVSVYVRRICWGPVGVCVYA